MSSVEPTSSVSVTEDNKNENSEIISKDCPVNVIPAKKIKYSTRRQQKYRKAWEFYPEFKLWLESVENNVYKAKCKICGRVLVADISVLQLHACSKKHIQSCKLYLNALDKIEKSNTRGRSSNPLPRVDSSTGGSKDVSEDILLDNLTIKG